MKIKSEKGYDATISLVWETKALIYEETRHMDLKRYIEYMEKDIALLKKKFRRKYTLVSHKHALARKASPL
ncbi:MAG: hypothetical protein NTV89_19455 [Proteobacteria bacterium]|nr:hypothetical protein [Pseudomonadota bacterium]